MDPITIVTVVIGAVGTLMTAFKELEEIRSTRQKRKADLDAGGPAPHAEFEASIQISSLANRLFSRLSRKDSSSKNEKFIKELLELRKDIATLLDELGNATLSNVSICPQIQTNTTAIEVDDKNIDSWTKRAMKIKRKLENLITSAEPVNGEPGIIPLEHSGILSNRQFCYGAILCQHGQADAKVLATQNNKGDHSSPQSQFICIHCNLEVGYYDSVGNLRAFYRCLACHLAQKQLDFYTAEALTAHMETHPGFSFLPPKLEAASEQAVKQDMELFLKAEVPSLQSTANTQSSLSDEDGTTAISSQSSHIFGERPMSFGFGNSDDIPVEERIFSPMTPASPTFSSLSMGHPQDEEPNIVLQHSNSQNAATNLLPPRHAPPPIPDPRRSGVASPRTAKPTPMSQHLPRHDDMHRRRQFNADSGPGVEASYSNGTSGQSARI
ncbi:hypothetical protein CaCOL14_012548 [Colletotrichum acutatum]